MKFECIHDCVFHGKCVNKGEVIDLTSSVDTPAFNASFKPLTNNDKEDVQEKKVDEFGKERITKAGLQKRLDELGVPYSARDSWEKLLERFKEATIQEA